MAEKHRGAEDESFEAAQAAMSFAFEARAAVQSYGTIFQALLNILKNSALFDEFERRGGLRGRSRNG